MILRDVKIHFPGDYMRFQKLFLYECVRIYNNYADVADSQYTTQKIEVLKMMKRNFRGIWLTDLPIGHKVLFTKLGIRKPEILDGKIVI